MFTSCLRINGALNIPTQLCCGGVLTTAVQEMLFQPRSSDINCQQQLSAQGNPLIHCGGNSVCLKDRISTLPAYSTFPPPLCS